MSAFAERHVLSKMLEDGTVAEVLRTGLTAEDFKDPGYKRIMQWAQTAYERDGIVVGFDHMNIGGVSNYPLHHPDTGQPASRLFRDLPFPTEWYVREMIATKARAEYREVQYKANLMDEGVDVSHEMSEQDIFLRLDQFLYEATDVLAKYRSILTGSTKHQPLTRDELMALPDVPSLIEGVLHQESVVFLSGAYGSYKSFLALDWALSVGTGTAWHYRGVEQGPVLYVAAEGFAGYKRRAMAWEKHQGHQYDHVYMHRGLNLGNAESVTALANHAERIGARLIVIDTLHACTAGMDENSNKDAGVVFGALQRLRDAMDGGTVLVVHHHGKDSTKGSRGASAWEADADAVYHLKREEGTPNTSLQCRKMKDGSEGESWTLQAKQVDIGNGDTSLVLVQVAQQTTYKVSLTPKALNALDILKAHTVAVPALTMNEWAELIGVKRPTMIPYRDALFSAGLIVNLGTEARPLWAPALHVPTPSMNFNDHDEDGPFT